ncbi:MAG: HAD hydrolase family protein [Desulfobacteraceae bacterium]
MHKDKLAGIKLVLLDVDGVLTDGSIVYTDAGEEIKRFDSKDGLGLRLLMKSGISAGIITGRKSQALLHRCRNLGIDLIFDNVKHDKRKAFDTILENTGFTASETAFAGDDLPDIPVMKKAGIGFAVADAAKEVVENADIVLSNPGGCGAVREISEHILKAKGKWLQAIAPFLT